MNTSNLVRFSDPGQTQIGNTIWASIPDQNPPVWVDLNQFSDPEDVTGELRLPTEIRHLWHEWVELATRVRAQHIPSPGDAPVPAIRFVWDPFVYDVSSEDLFLTWWEFKLCADHIMRTLADVGCPFSIYYEDQKKYRPDGIEKNVGIEWGIVGD